MEFVARHIAEEGSLMLRVAKSIFYGEPAAGKTCTRKRLTGEIHNLRGQQPLPSTGIENPCTINLYHETEKLSVLLTKSKEEWNCSLCISYLLPEETSLNLRSFANFFAHLLDCSFVRQILSPSFESKFEFACCRSPH